MSAAVTTPIRRPRGPVAWYKDPWRKPRFLSAFTWLYLSWSLLPVLIAILLSFSKGRSNSQLQGLGLNYWVNDPVDGLALLQNSVLKAAIVQTLRLSLITMIIAVPLGVLFAIGIDRWRGRPADGANLLMLFTFVMPEIIIGVSMFYVVIKIFSSLGVHLGTGAQLLGLITYQISYPVIIVRARLLSISKEYEEAGMDLGATPRQAVRSVLLPMLYPAIFASFAIVFADTVDDFVTVAFLNGGASSQPLSLYIYNAVRASPTPAVNAAATFLLVTSTLAIALGYVAYKRASRGQSGGNVTTFTQL